MAYPVISSTANFLFGTQPSHIIRHYRRYLGEKSLAYPIYTALAAYFAYRLWQVWSYDPNAVVSPEYGDQQFGREQHQRDGNPARNREYSSAASGSQTQQTLYGKADENEFGNNNKCEASFQALWHQIETKKEEIKELQDRVTALEERRQHTSASSTARRGYSNAEREKTNRTRHYAALGVNTLAVLFAANWSFAPLWQSAHFVTILSVFGGEFTYYLSPANEEYRRKCQFDLVDGNLQKFCVSLLHSPFIHSLDQMIGDKLGKFAGIENDYTRM